MSGAAGNRGSLRLDLTRPADSPPPPDLRIAAGEAISLGLCESPLAGKTTVTNLLTRRLRPDQGRVLIDGLDMRSLDLLTYRRRLG